MNAVGIENNHVSDRILRQEGFGASKPPEGANARHSLETWSWWDWREFIRDWLEFLP